MAGRHTTPPIWRVIRDSFDEAEFLWARWEDALDSDHHTLDDVSHWVEERLLGGIDGVVLGGERAIEELLAPALRARRGRPARVAAYALASMGPAGDAALIEALRTAADARIEDIARGMELTEDRHAPQRWFSAVRDLPAQAQAAIVRVFAYRQIPAPAGMDRVLDGSVAQVQLRCLELAATTRAPWARPYVEWGLQRSTPALRIAAAAAGMTLGMREARHAACELVSAGVEGSDALLTAIALGYGERALPLMLSRAGRSTPTRELFDALTAIGTVAAADAAARLLADGAQAELAAESLRAIAGPDVDKAVPQDAGAAALVAAWTKARPAYAPAQRYFAGRPFAPQGLGVALRSARMRQRHVLAADLALRTAGLGRVRTTAWTAVQRAQMSAVGPR